MNTVTDREKLEHLLNGGVITGGNTFRKLDNNGILTFCDKDGKISQYGIPCPCTCIDLSDDIVVPWYEDIPEEGILCFVWDDDTERDISRIVEFDGSDIPFKDIRSSWYGYAVPLTPEQLTLYNQLMFSAHAL